MRKNFSCLINEFHRARRKEKDLEISWLCHFISQLCKLIFWYWPFYRDTRSSTFSFSRVEFERTGDIPGWNDWTSQGAFDQQVRLTRFGESRDGVARERKRLEIQRNPAAESFLKGCCRVEGNCWKINSLYEMIRLPRMEEQSKSDQIGQNKFTVLAGSCRRRLDELTPEKFIEQPRIKFPR